MSQYELAIFDVDGTLLDTTEGVLASVIYAMRVQNLSVPDTGVLRTFIGPPIQDSFAKLYGIQGQDLQEIADIFREHYKNCDLLKAAPYQGIFEVFQLLSKRNVKSAIATYKRQDYAETIVKYFGFDQFTNIIYGADSKNQLKKVDIIRKCIEQSSVSDYSKIVMIGDSAHDALGAKQLNIDFIGVTYGFGFRNNDEVDQYPNIGTAKTPVEIMDLL